MLRRIAAWLLDDRSSGYSSEVRTLVRDEEGAIFVEYLTLTLMVTVVSAMATLSLGHMLLRLFYFQKAVIAIPMP